MNNSAGLQSAALSPAKEGLVTRNVCIDTSEYVAAQFGFRTASFRRLVELAQTEKVHLFITPIIRREVDSNIGELAQLGSVAVKQMRDKAPMLRNVALPAVRALFDTQYARDEVIAHLHGLFEVFLQRQRLWISRLL